MSRVVALFLVVVLHAAPLRAAVSFDGTANGTAVTATAAATGTPVSICAWFQATSAASIQVLAALTDTAAGFTGLFQLVTQTGGGGTIAAGTYNGTTYDQALSVATFSTNTWTSVCAVYASPTSRSVYIKGGNKITNTTNITPTGIDVLSIGYRASNIPAFPVTGRIAEIGVWNVALSDDDATTLGNIGGSGARGMAPPCVRPDKLIAYYPMIEKGASGGDLFGARALTWGSGTATVDHPPVLRCQ